MRVYSTAIFHLRKISVLVLRAPTKQEKKMLLVCFRVVIQNERYEEWSHTLIQLKRLFTEYQRSILKYHARPNVEVPKASISTAAQGNFLEVLNMALNGL